MEEYKKSEAQFVAQFGEDNELSKIFASVPQGTCVEVGGFDGITGSNTYYFERIGWECLLVEPIPELCEKIRKIRKCTLVQAAASSKSGTATLIVPEKFKELSTLHLSKIQQDRILAEGGAELNEITVQVKTLDQILQDASITKIDFITIDVEGHEIEVLKGFTIQSYTPRVIILEDSFCRRDQSAVNYLRHFGYVNFKRTGCNDWFCKLTDSSLIDSGQVTRLRLLRKKAAVLTIFAPLVRRVKPLLSNSVISWLKAISFGKDT